MNKRRSPKVDVFKVGENYPFSTLLHINIEPKPKSTSTFRNLTKIRENPTKIRVRRKR